MANLEELQDLAKEINNYWAPEFSALVQDNELRVKHNRLFTVIALVDEKFDIEMVEEGFDEVLDQLNYIIEK